MPIAPHLMIVDDDHFSTAYMQQVLRQQQLRVTAVPTASQAQAHLRTHPADLVLLDVTLPDASGFAVCEWLRQTYADVGIMFVSGHTALADRLQAFEVGADDFLGKPFLTAELVARVRAVLRRRTPEDRAGLAHEGHELKDQFAPARKTDPYGLGTGGDLVMEQDRIVRAGGCSLDLAAQRLALPDGAAVTLSALETQMLALLMARPGQLVLRADLAHYVWGADRSATLTAQRAIEADLWRLVARIEPDPQWLRYVQVIRHLGARFIARAT